MKNHLAQRVIWKLPGIVGQFRSKPAAEWTWASP